LLAFLLKILIVARHALATWDLEIILLPLGLVAKMAQKSRFTINVTVRKERTAVMADTCLNVVK
jgi:hypothetical protein